MIKLFSIPDSKTVRSINKILLDLYKNKRELFYDDILIDSAYGCPEGTPWNGGRELPKEHEPILDIYKTFEYYNSQGLSYRLTFTNFMLTYFDPKDTYSRVIPIIAEQYKCSYIVSNQSMYDYLAERYANPITWSTTTNFGTTTTEIIDKTNSLSENNLVVIPYDFNNSDDIKKLVYPDNLEVLVNQECQYNCPLRQAHYAATCLYNLGIITSRPDCLFKKYKYTNWESHSIINHTKLDEYCNLGINKFKLSGRTEPEQLISSYLHYFFKPEVQAEAVEYFPEKYVNTDETKYWLNKLSKGL